MSCHRYNDQISCDLLSRYMSCAERIWGLFTRDPLPEGCAAQSWLYRLEALLDHDLLSPKIAQSIIKRDELSDNPAPKFNYYRASGDCICGICNELYYDHPTIHGKERTLYGCSELFVLCNTDRVKC